MRFRERDEVFVISLFRSMNKLGHLVKDKLDKMSTQKLNVGSKKW